jgi:hypothetical protein
MIAWILICQTMINPQDCTRATARSVMRVQIESSLPLQCFIKGQAWLAQSPLEVGPDEWVRIVCDQVVAK